MKKIINSREQGFTLVELMIVVAIIGILAAIAIPNYQTYQAKARQGEAKIALSGIFTALQSFAAEQSSFTGCLVGAGFGLNGSNKRYYIIGIDMASVDLDMCGPTNSRDCAEAGWTPDGAGGYVPTACAAASVAGAFAMADGPNVFNANATVVNATMVGDGDLATLSNATLAIAPMATIVNNTAFVAGAAGVVSQGGVVDTWSIDQNKNLYNGNNGL